MNVTRHHAKRLLELYASESPRSCRSCIGDSRGNPSADVALTVGLVVENLPPAYRYPDGSSPLSRWVECYRTELRVRDAHGAANALVRRSTTRAVIDRETQRLDLLRRVLDLAERKTEEIERSARFEPALDWLAYWIQGALEHASPFEMHLWRARMMEDS